MSTVIGVDIGSAASVVAFVGKGVVDIVQNEVSMRSTATLVGYTNEDGYMLGDQAGALIKSNLKNTARNLMHVVGRSAVPDEERKDLDFYSLAKIVDGEDGKLGFEVNYKGEQCTFAAQQVLGSYLGQLRRLSQDWTKVKVHDLVLAVPSDFSDAHRNAVVDAAAVAGLNVLRVMNSHTAVALAYGIYRSKEFHEEEPTRVAFVNAGHSVFEVTIAEFVRGKLYIKASAMDRSAGGRDIDRALMTKLAATFDAKHGTDVLSSKKAILKLEEAITKTKKTLSANSEAACSVECLYDDFDMSATCSRDELEEVTAGVAAKMKAVLTRALKEAGGGDVDFVEVVGGTSRVPFVKAAVSEVFVDKTLSTTLNADECVARGCALQAAMLSPAFKVREFLVNDLTQQGVHVSWDSQGDEAPGSADLFEPGDALNISKLLTFQRAQPFHITATYTDGSLLLPGSARQIGRWRVEMPTIAEREKVKVHATLNGNGVFELTSATRYSSEVQLLKVKEKRLKQKKLPDADEGDEEEKKEEAEKPKEDKEEEEKKEEGEAEKKEGEADASAEKKCEKKDEYEEVEVTKEKTVTKKTPLDIVLDPDSENAARVSANMLDAWKDTESKLWSEKQEVVLTQHARNDLEGFILSLKERAAGRLGGFMAPGLKNDLDSDRQKAEDWLYDTYDAKRVDYVEKLDSMQEKYTRLAESLMAEAEDREAAVTGLKSTCSDGRLQLNNDGEDYAHIDAAKKTEGIKMCDDAEAWCDALVAKQASMAAHEAVAVKVADLDAKTREVAQAVTKILEIPKPAPPKEEEKVEEGGANEGTNVAEAEQENSAGGGESPAKETADPEQENVEAID